MIYKKQPRILEWYFRKIRKTPGAWITLPTGIYVPSTAWPSLYKTLPAIMAHEETHYKRMTGWFWCLRYFFSREFRYREELVAMRVELALQPDWHRPAYASWLAKSLVVDYDAPRTCEQALADLMEGM